MTSSDSKREPDFDLRTVRWYVEKGTYDWEDYAAYLKKLPDLASKSEQLDVPLPGEIENDKVHSAKREKGVRNNSGTKSKSKNK
jgi:hypothetical protein